MISIDEMEEMLDEIAQALPEIFYKELNGGILLLPELKLHPSGIGDELYIMGEYHRGGGQGRYIVIYYGSFAKAYEHAPPQVVRERLAETLKHEFTHHLESLAGERGLEKKDEQELARYLSRRVRRG